MSEIDWRCLRFPEMTTDELYALLRLRSAVFVVEQECVYQDIDDRDQSALHLVAARAQEIILYARLLPPGSVYVEAAIGRIISAPSVRGMGMGRELVARAIDLAQREWPGQGIRISAQHHLRDFYQELGFASVGAPYMEDDIPHVEMLLVE